MKFTLNVIFGLHIFVFANAGDFYPIEEKIPGAKESIFTAKVSQILRVWPPEGFPAVLSDSEPIWIRGMKVPGDADYLGIKKRMLVHVPLSVFAKTVLDFVRYKDGSSIIKNAELVSKDGNRTTVLWESYSPAFFVPNTKYEQSYVIDERARESVRGRVLFRFQLRNSNHIEFSDGVVVLESVGENTLFTSFDFVKPDTGIFGAFVSRNKMWEKTIEGYCRGDLVLKIKAEHATWKMDQVKDYLDRIMNKVSILPVQFAPLPAIFGE